MNPVSTIVLLPMISAPQVLGILFWDNFEVTAWSSLGMGLLFIATYLAGITVAKEDVAQAHEIS